MNWIFFALLAPLFWAFSNYIDKYSLDRYVSNIYDFLFFSTLTSWLFVPVLILIFGFPALTIYSIVPVLLGILLVYSYGFYGKALEAGETSRIVIMFKLIPVLTLALGFLFLNQTLTGSEFVAFLLVLAGATMVSLERVGFKFKLYAGTAWILIDIVLWSGIFLTADWLMSTHMSFGEFFVLDTLGTALAGPIMCLFPSIRQKIVVGWKESKPQKFGWFILNNFLDFFGQMSVKKSLSLAPAAGLVTVAIQVQSLYIIALGVVLTLFFSDKIKEDISFKNLSNKIIGAVIMFAGIYLLFMTT